MVEAVQATVHQARIIRNIIQAVSHHPAAAIRATAHQTVVSKLLTIIMVAEVHQAEAALQKHLNRMRVIM